MALDQPNSGTYAWTPPDSVQTNTPEDPVTPVFSALFKVVAHDGDGKVGNDVSDAPFAISNQAKVSVPGGAAVSFGLRSVGPIPSAGPVRIAYALAHDADVRLAIVDVRGPDAGRAGGGSEAGGHARSGVESRFRTCRPECIS